MTVSYGYDIHRIKLTEKAYAGIKLGKEIKIQGQGFMHEEDGLCKDYWVFNRVPGEIYFWLDNGAEFNCEELGVEFVEWRE